MATTHIKIQFNFALYMYFLPFPDPINYFLFIINIRLRFNRPVKSVFFVWLSVPIQLRFIQIVHSGHRKKSLSLNNIPHHKIIETPTQIQRIKFPTRLIVLWGADNPYLHTEINNVQSESCKIRRIREIGDTII